MRCSPLAPAAILSLLVAALGGSPLDAVVLSEIHYHPPDPLGKRLEFLELHNPSPRAVSLEGWQLRGGVDFTFGPGVTLEAGGYMVVCSDRQALLEAWPVDPGLVAGEFEGALDNAGESVRLVDAFGAVREIVVFDDKEPWSESPDGDGPSLQRVCAFSEGLSSHNWFGATPTPAAPPPASQCPAPSAPRSDVVISEIFYNPPGETRGRDIGDDGEGLEFVEIHNLSGQAINLGAWRLARGVRFTFRPGTTLPARGYVVVARDEDAVRRRFGLDSSVVVGSFTGKLANGGERVTLEDSRGDLVDSVQYGDSGMWPYGADGHGRSLEKIVLAAPGDDPTNWASSRIVPGGFLHQETEGAVGPTALVREVGSVRFVLSLDGEGVVLVDEVVIEDVSQPGVNLLANGAFENGLEGWTKLGNALESSADPAGGVGGSGGLSLKSSGDCRLNGCGGFNGVIQIVSNLRRDARYRISVEVKRISGSFRFRAGFLDGTGVEIVHGTPGAENSVAASVAPPHISGVGRYPEQPVSGEPTWITARVQGVGDPVVRLLYEAGTESGEVFMADDGMRLDGEAGDGIYGVELPGFPDQTQVIFRIVAEAGGRRGIYPSAVDPELPRIRETRGFYVNDNQPDSSLPVYHILLDGVDGDDWLEVNRALNCSTLERAAFAFRGELYPEVGVRFRGNTACWINKRNFKVRFNREKKFRDVRKINLNSQWTDKAFVREYLAWDFMEQLGAPYVETEYLRLHVSGAYYGLYLHVEHPDEDFLERLDLDPDGTLYKARQPEDPFQEDLSGVPLFPAGEYHRGWEEEASEGGDYADIEEFTVAMHSDGDPFNGGPSSDFWSRRTFEDMTIAFQVSQVVLNNIDSFAKNHFLYHDLESDRWGFIAWDLDLVFGKYFTRDAVNVQEGRQVGTLNDLMRSDVGLDLNPWSMTSVLGNIRLNWYLDYFFRADGDHYRRAYLIRLWDIIDEKYRNDVYDPVLDRLFARLAVEEVEDFQRWGRYPSNVSDYPQDMLSNIEIVKRQLRLHRDFLLRYFELFHPDIRDHDRVKITEVMTLGEGGREDLEYIEILNTTGRTVDLTGWTVSGIDFTFRPGSVLPARRKAIVARTPSSLRSHYPERTFEYLFGPYTGSLDNEGETLRIRDAGPGYPATIDYLRYDSGGEWPRARAGYSIELVDESPSTDNDGGGAWRQSEGPGGSPGDDLPTFIRSELVEDGRFDITDVVANILYQFLGDEAPECLDVADVDDNGLIEITDPVYHLAYLFLGGDPPPAPFPDPGVDLTDDTLDCPGG